MSGRLFYVASCACVLGIGVRSFVTIDTTFLVTLIFTASVLCLFGYVWRYGFATPIFLTALALVSFSLGVLRFDITVRNDASLPLDQHIGEHVVLSGHVSKEVDVREKAAHVTVDIQMVNGEPDDGRVLVIADRHAAVEYGDAITVMGVLKKPEAFETDLGRVFDYPGYLAARGIHHTLSFGDITVTGVSEKGNPIIASLLTVKRVFVRSIESVIPEPASGLGEGILLGVKRALGEDLEAAFRATGVIHIVVLSGYNITIVAEAIMRLLAAFFMPRTRIIIGITAICAFALMVGLSATVIRASIMAVLVLIARATGKTYAVIRALVFSALLMLFVNPLLLVHDPGFQLSFLATLGLILFAPLIELRLRLIPTRFQVREFVTSTIATQLFVLPLILYSIGELSLVAVPVNVLVLMVVPLAMLLTFMAGIFGAISTVVAMPFAYAAYLVLSYIISVVEIFASFPYASVVIPSIPFWVVAASYVFLTVFILRYAPRTKAPVVA